MACDMVYVLIDQTLGLRGHDLGWLDASRFGVT